MDDTPTKLPDIPVLSIAAPDSLSVTPGPEVDNPAPIDVQPEIVRIQSRLNNELIEHYRMISGFESTEIIRLEKEFLKLTKNSDFMSRDVFRRIPAIEVCPLYDRVELVFFELSSVSATSVDRANPASVEGLQNNTGMRSGIGGAWLPSIGGLWSWLTLGTSSGGGPSSDRAVTPVSVPSGEEQIPTSAAVDLTVWVEVDATNCGDLLAFEDFLIGLSLFNSPGMPESKLKLSFRLQDFDGDGGHFVLSLPYLLLYYTIICDSKIKCIAACVGVLSREDLIEYISRIAGFTAPATEVEAGAEAETASAEPDAAGETKQATEGETEKGPAKEPEEGAEDAAPNSESAPTAKVKTEGLTMNDIEEVVDQLFLECVDTAAVAPGKQQGVVVADYIRIVALSEFATKLRITI